MADGCQKTVLVARTVEKRAAINGPGGGVSFDAMDLVLDLPDGLTLVVS